MEVEDALELAYGEYGICEYNLRPCGICASIPKYAASRNADRLSYSQIQFHCKQLIPDPSINSHESSVLVTPTHTCNFTSLQPISITNYPF